MEAYKVATKIDRSGELRLSELPFQPGEEVEVIILRSPSETGTTVPRRELIARAQASQGMWADRDPDEFLKQSRSGLSGRDEDLERARLDS